MTSVRQFGILGKRSLPKIKILSVRLSGELSAADGVVPMAVDPVAIDSVAVTVAVAVVATVWVTTAAGGGVAGVTVLAGAGDGATVAAVDTVGAALPCAAAVWLLSEQLVIKRKSSEMPKINVLDIGDLGKNKSFVSRVPNLLGLVLFAAWLVIELQIIIKP